VSAFGNVRAPPGVVMVASPQVLRKAERSQGTKAKAASLGMAKANDAANNTSIIRPEPRTRPRPPGGANASRHGGG